MNTSFLDDIFTISHGGKDVIERKDSNNKILWERAIPKTTSKSASISLTNTRKTGGDGVTYPIFAPSKVLPSVIAYGKCTQSGTPAPATPVDIVCNNGTVKVSEQTVYVEGTPEVITVAGGGTEQTASVADLFATGEYEDTQNVMTGTITRNVGIKVFDGTEQYSVMNYGYATDELSDFPNENFVPLCTHFVGKTTASSTADTVRLYFTSGGVPRTYFFVDQTVDDFSTVDKFKAWLAAQYAAGTPVIVVYPLATPQTEQVTPSSDQIELDHKDTYTLSTSGSVSGLLIQATYLGR